MFSPSRNRHEFLAVPINKSASGRMTMTKAYIGGCACGAIRYETSSQPIFENHCQCRDCQKRSGTGHGSYLTFPRRADVTITGEANTWRVTSDSGNEKI